MRRVVTDDVAALKHKVPEATIEILTPDFLGVEEQALGTILAERPDVFNHNIETVRGLLGAHWVRSSDRADE